MAALMVTGTYRVTMLNSLARLDSLLPGIRVD